MLHAHCSGMHEIIQKANIDLQFCIKKRLILRQEKIKCCFRLSKINDIYIMGLAVKNCELFFYIVLWRRIYLIICGTVFNKVILNFGDNNRKDSLWNI